MKELDHLHGHRPIPRPIHRSTDSHPRIAVIGGGHLGRIHTRLLSEGGLFELSGVADPSLEARVRVKTEYGVDVYERHQDLRGRIDAAVVAAPTDQHYAIGLELLQNGIHVFMEKPLTTTAAQADVLLATARSHGCVLQVGHVERFNPAWIAALPYLKQPRFIRCVRTSGYTGRSTDVGVALDLMIHDLDLVLSFVDAEVVHLAAAGHSIIGPHEDVAEARFVFSNGTAASFFASRVHPTPRRQMELHQSSSTVFVDFASGAASWLNHHQPMPGGDLLFASCAVNDCNAIADELRDFHASILSHTAPRVDGAAGRAAVALAEQIAAKIAMTSFHADFDTRHSKAG